MEKIEIVSSVYMIEKDIYETYVKSPSHEVKFKQMLKIITLFSILLFNDYSSSFLNTTIPRKKRKKKVWTDPL